MKKSLIFTLLSILLVRFGFSVDKQEKFFVVQYYDITFAVYKYSAEDQLNDKKLPGNIKRELLKKNITVCEDESYLENFTISKNIQVKFKFDFKEFLVLKILINDKESVVFQNKARNFKLNFEAAQNENYLIDTVFVLSRFGTITGGVGIYPVKTTKKKIKK